MNYLASKLSAYVSVGIVAVGAALSLFAQVQPFVPPAYATDAAAVVTVLGGIKALLSAIAAATQSISSQNQPKGQ